MLRSYYQYLNQLALWSQRLSMDGDSSLLRVCLIASAAQYLNLLALVMVWQALTPNRLLLTLPVFMGAIVLLVAVNAYFLSRYVAGRGDSSEARGRPSILVPMYLGGTLLTFIGAGVLLASRNS
ncbi:hypothetical protein [Noviluteimonas gilva]|uniref:Uncharacterized protein n=1 Tax=Noviluteimonas gilva TaxID=2682097 RepID=A0A7C9HS78_9GAMM|nr:hypothetical protein [Lysobacter gilvus]MUV14153.1 hypothetical protein [Lysobacter gilvus]